MDWLLWLLSGCVDVVLFYVFKIKSFWFGYFVLINFVNLVNIFVNFGVIYLLE